MAGTKKEIKNSAKKEKILFADKEQKTTSGTTKTGRYFIKCNFITAGLLIVGNLRTNTEIEKQ